MLPQTHTHKTEYLPLPSPLCTKGWVFEKSSDQVQCPCLYYLILAIYNQKKKGLFIQPLSKPFFCSLYMAIESTLEIDMSCQRLPAYIKYVKKTSRHVDFNLIFLYNLYNKQCVHTKSLFPPLTKIE